MTLLRGWWPLAVVMLVGAVLRAEPTRMPDPDPARFAQEITRIENRLANTPPGEGEIVFLGSSSIRRWNLAAAFPGLPVHNLGFGGSQWSDVRHYQDRLLIVPRPHTFVLYCGENDVNAGKPLEQIMADYRAFLTTLREREPQARIIVIGAKPSVRRAAIWDRIHAYNEASAAYLATLPNTVYLAPDPSFWLPDGTVRADYFVEDMLHLNDAGYRPWVEALQPLLATVPAAARAAP